jgi:hypothetical protein
MYKPRHRIDPEQMVMNCLDAAGVLGGDNRCRPGALVGDAEKTDEDSRSNRRPIELIGSPACQRSQISDRWAAE